MMTETERKKRLRRVIARFDDVNVYYIQRVAARIAKIMKLREIDIDVMTILAAVAIEVSEVNARAARAAKNAIPELHSLYRDELNSVYKSKRYAKALKNSPLSVGAKRALVDYTQNVSRNVAERVLELSESTTASVNYRRAADKAILAASGMSGDKEQAARKLIRETGSTGLQTQYESGQRRKLAKAVLQNVLDGMWQIRQHAHDVISEEVGFDAKEISAHPNSAPDHEPIQGRVFTLAEFARLQNHQDCTDIDGRFYPAGRRAIGELNCRHIALGFSTKYSTRRYTNEELEELARTNENGREINGKHYSLYEAGRMVKRLDAEAERMNDVAAAARAAGDSELLRFAKQRLKDIADAKKRYELHESDSGATSGAKKTKGWEGRHAARYYEEVRNRKPGVDASKIAKYTEFTKKQVEDIRQHMFIKKHWLDEGTVYKRFEPDYEQSQAWQRLTEGRGTDIDVLMLKHEYLELTEMRDKGYNYEKAHDIANEKYDWWTALMKSKERR